MKGVDGSGMQSPGVGFGPPEGDAAVSSGADGTGESSGLAGLLVGLVVDRRVSQDREDLLHWIGLDVVHASPAEFCGDLLHYVAHVDNDQGMATWRLAECTAGAEVAHV